MKLPAKTYVKAILNILISAVILLLCIWLLPKLIGFFMPFIIGWIVAWMASPVVRFFEEKLRIKRKAGSAFVIVMVLAIVILLCYAVLYIAVQQIVGFVAFAPELWSSAAAEIHNAGVAIENMLHKLPTGFQMNLETVFEGIGEDVTDWISGAESPAMDSIGNMAKQIPSLIVSIVVVLLSSYFFVADKSNIMKRYEQYCPQVFKNRLHIISSSFKNAVGGYLKAQIKIEVRVYVLLIIGLFILGVPYGWLIGIGIAFLDFLPIFGTGTVMIPWAVVKLLDGNYKMGIGLLITWGVGQLVRQIIQPKIVGDSMGLPALPTLFLIYLGYHFAGFGGMIIALPVGIILVQLYEEGMFDTTVKSFQILFAGMNHFRKIRDEDMLIVHEYMQETGEKESTTEHKV